jgi:hypothetical protein
MKKGLKNQQEIAEMVNVLGWSEWECVNGCA